MFFLIVHRKIILRKLLKNIIILFFRDEVPAFVTKVSGLAGIAPADVDGFVAECRDLDLPIRGLMCIPPVEETPSLHFSLLAKIAERNGLSGLSMGMSGDFEEAISFGATHVRVGSAIFGERVYD